MSFALRRLLDLQRQDTAIDQLVHKRAILPQRDALAEDLKNAAALRAALATATSERDVVASDLAKTEAEVSAIDQRITSINARLFGSDPISPKDAQAMTEEVDHLKQRKSTFEDTELEVMEALEPKQTEVARIEGEARELAARMGATQGELKSAEAEIDEVIANERAKRDEIAKDVDAGLLSKYEALRPKFGGVAVAALEGSQCGGCHLSLAAAELSRVNRAGPDEIVTCEECGRILVKPS